MTRPPMKPSQRLSRRKRQRDTVRWCIFCSPYSGDMEGNTEKARRYSRFAADAGTIPIAPHLLFPQFLSEDTERELAIFMDLVLLGKCEQLWVFGGEVSDGMRREIGKAKQKNMTIRYFTEDMEETECR